MIEVVNVTKKLGSFELGEIAFRIPKGYICGVVGQNGAGKTTLLHLLLGLYEADKGEIRIDGRTFLQDEKGIHDETGVVLIEDLFDRSLTLLQNGRYYGKYFSGYDEEVLKGYLKEFRLDENGKYGSQSKGEMLKFQFAFALSHNAKLLVLDEPTGNFDIQFREQFFELVQRFVEDGERSVVLATHLTDDLDRVADYLIYLEEGRQVFAGDMEEFREKYRIVAGEAYKVRLLPKDRIVCMEEGAYGTKALVTHYRMAKYDEELVVTAPTIEEFMYFYCKRPKAKRRG